ncbi:gamma-butyrobetaine hydroxylase-like domain-containing protein [Parvibium lacunae]|uniref:DUF971 domain-containing protein n=1 Tax=Parvibium lacunae TaxID=1888893 RepID=A0A368L4Y1_9BURK|nr:DUF971 domain-containing protein [Parvibium lacunae]RCS58646.1 DUF971 domain-containing protein [Parvibium lacunae]
MTEMLQPIDIVLHTQSQVLEITFQSSIEGQPLRYRLPAEYLRVYSPSAEVQGHSPEQAILQTGKRQVKITAIEPVGHYALKLIFSDGHDTGLYTWPYLYKLGHQQEARWQDYLQRLDRVGASRDLS